MRILGNLEKSEQVEVLPVYIAEDFYRRLQVKEHGLCAEDLDSLVYQVLDGLLVHFHWLTPDASFDLDKLRYDHVQGKLSLRIAIRLHEGNVLLELGLHRCQLVVADAELGLVIGVWAPVLVDGLVLEQVGDALLLLTSRRGSFYLHYYYS